MSMLQVFESIFMFFLMVAWIWAIVGVMSDVFRSSDLGGLAKGLWMIFIISVPWLGVLSYLVVRGKGMEKRSSAALANAGEMQRAYIQSIAGVSTADELSKLADLRDKGVITDAELEAQKLNLLS